VGGLRRNPRTWDVLRDPDPKKLSVILHDGELRLEWIVLAAGADLLLAASQQGKSPARTGFRADQPAGPSK